MRGQRSHCASCPEVEVGGGVRGQRSPCPVCPDCVGGGACVGGPCLLGAAGRGGVAAGQPPDRGDGLPEDQELRPPLLPLPHHRQPGEAEENDEDR